MFWPVLWGGGSTSRSWCNRTGAGQAAEKTTLLGSSVNSRCVVLSRCAVLRTPGGLHPARWPTPKPLYFSISGQRLAHPHCNHEARDSGEDADNHDRRCKTEQIGDDTGENGDHGIARVAPKAVDANRASPLGRMCDVADRGQERRVDEGGAEAHEDRADKPPAE
jgi:hypothetical protein